MSGAVATRETANGTGAEVVGAAPTAPSRTVHERKLAVMARCSEIAPDKTHPAHHFQYVSIQNLSNHLRKFCAEEGLDVVTSITDGNVVVELVNAAAPEERIVTTWPVVAGDKGYAFSIKFPLMRLFLVGDGEENDEAVMAQQSGAAATQAAAQQPAMQARTPHTTGTGRQPLGPCPECAEEGITAASGKPACYWPARKEGHPPRCNGYRDGIYLNHEMRSERASSGGDVDPDEIPFHHREDERVLRSTRCHDR